MTRLSLLTLALLGAFALSAGAVGAAPASTTRPAAVIIIIGADPPPNILPPKPRSTRGMRMVVEKRRVSAGESFAAAAGYFVPGEYVTVWDFFAGNRKVSWLNGGNASGKGVLELVRDTVSVTAQGRHRLCAKGERSKRVACAVYVVSGGQLETGPGYVEPSSDGGYTSPEVGPGYVAPGLNP
jgi:hypothetical protein